VKFFERRESAKSRRFNFELPKQVINPSLDNHLELPSITNFSSFAARSLTWVGALAIVFLAQLILISQVHYSSAQFKATETLRYELANGTAPVGQVDSSGALLDAGTPVALLKIDKLGLEETVLEGTASNITTDGPGHRRDTVLPGQAGISVIFGRQAAYGGVFANISSLNVGDKIVTITGQGESSYTFSRLRVTGDEATNALGNSKGRLTLVTTAGIPFLPSGVVRIEATLDGEPKITPVRVIQNGAIPASEKDRKSVV
jgi:LPXTG-site transpeptidase (sortase) family protein